eukprot:9028756-Lingulodinium_polyedra.AAC.1
MDPVVGSTNESVRSPKPDGPWIIFERPMRETLMRHRDHGAGAGWAFDKIGRHANAAENGTRQMCDAALG